MKSSKRNLFMLLAVLTILPLLLSACGPVAVLRSYADNAKDKNKDKITQNGMDNETDDQDAGANRITICHKTGSAQNPYVEITVSNNGARNGHAKHQGDIIPEPEDGCPSSSSTTAIDQDKDNENETENETGGNANQITICHKTGSAKHPYVEITTSNDAAQNGHAKHQGDIIPAPKDGCPKTVTATSAP